VRRDRQPVAERLVVDASSRQRENRRTVLRLALLTAVAALLAAPVASAADQQIAAAPNGEVFTPSEVTIGIGDTVTVSRAAGGFEAHNVRYEDQASGCPPSPTATAWSCPRTFGSAGDFRFYCELHVTMRATVHVVSGPLPAPTPSPGPGPAPGPGGSPSPERRTVPIRRLAVLPSNDGCVDRDSFRLRLKRRAGSTAIEEGRVFVNGKRVAVRRNERLTAPVVVRRLPAGRVTLRIQSIASNGDRLVGSRRYRTCPPE
jgi:plastocyanin